MSPVLDDSRAVFREMPDPSFDNADGQPWADGPRPPRGGGARRPRAVRPRAWALALPPRLHLNYYRVAFCCLWEGLAQAPPGTSDLSPGTSRAGHGRRIGFLEDSAGEGCPGPSKLY